MKFEQKFDSVDDIAIYQVGGDGWSYRIKGRDGDLYKSQTIFPDPKVAAQVAFDLIRG